MVFSVRFFLFFGICSFLFLNFSLVERVGCRLGQQLQSWCYIRLSPSALRLRQNAIKKKNLKKSFNVHSKYSSSNFIWPK